MIRPVLFLAHSYPPENIVGALRPYRFAKYLPKFGYQPYIITASAQPPDKPAHIRYAADRPGLVEKLLHRVLVFQESFSWAASAVREAETLLREVPAHLVYSTSPPFGVHIAARRLKRRYGLKWIADFRDPMQGNDARQNLPIRMVDKFFEPDFLRDADLLIANTQAASELLKIRYPQYRNKIQAIYNGFDPENAALCALPIPSRPYRVLTHAGSLYRVSMTQSFMDALSRAIRESKLDPASLRLRMFGLIENYSSLQASPAFQHLLSAGVLECTPDHLPLAEARRAMAESDYLLTIDRYREGGIIQLPAKTFEYVQIGRPILAFTGRNSPMEYALKTSGVRHACVFPESDTETAIVDKVVNFLRLPTDPSPVSEAYQIEFGAPHQAERLAGFFDSLAS